MSKAKGTKRTKKMDILFMIDATGSMASTIQAAHDKAEDLAFDLRTINRTALFRFACICYRDPVDTKDDVHQLFDFSEEIENLSEFLETVKASGGADWPEDFVGALNLSFDRLSWDKESKKAIIWIADAPAHGKRYCGKENHQEEEPKLEPLIEKLAKENYYFVGISLKSESNTEGADRTFSEMKKIYEANKGKPFRIESFSPDANDEVGDIAKTMAESTMGVVDEMLKVYEE